MIAKDRTANTPTGQKNVQRRALLNYLLLLACERGSHERSNDIGKLVMSQFMYRSEVEANQHQPNALARYGTFGRPRDKR